MARFARFRYDKYNGRAINRNEGIDSGWAVINWLVTQLRNAIRMKSHWGASGSDHWARSVRTAAVQARYFNESDPAVRFAKRVLPIKFCKLHRAFCSSFGRVRLGDREAVLDGTKSFWNYPLLELSKRMYLYTWKKRKIVGDIFLPILQ